MKKIFLIIGGMLILGVFFWVFKSTNFNWYTYSNTEGRYEIRYPAKAKISFGDISAKPENCVLIETEVGYIQINNKATTLCGGKISSGEKIEDKLIINSRFDELRTSGFISPDKKYSFLSFEYRPGILITYGVNAKVPLNEKEYQEALNEIKSILATIKNF